MSAREAELFRLLEQGGWALTGPQNRPGLPELRYRVGTHPEMLARMISRLHTWTLPDGPSAGSAPLASLNPRPRADLAVCFLDAWAVVGDVLTFYQERIANEGFLRTATEERSVWELVSALGYDPDPGAAAGTHLVFWVTEGAVRSGLADTAPLPATAREVGFAAPPVRVPAGTVVQSVPRDGGQPQTFETSHDIEARAEWNSATVHLPRRAVRPRIDPAATRIRLEGLRPGLRAGDPLLLVGDAPAGGGEAPWLFRTVRKVEPDRKQGYTVVSWDPVPPPPEMAPLANPRAFTFRARHALFGHDAPRWEAQTLETQRRYRDLRGGVFRSLDGGASWAAVNGYFPDAPEQREAPSRWIPAALPDADAVRALAVGPDGALYAAVAGKGVYRSLDRGASWQPASVGLRKTDVHSLTVSARGYLFAGTSGGGVFRSRDGATSWDDVGGGVMISHGGRMWKPVNTRLPTTVVRCVLAYTHPRTRKHYLIAGTDDGLFGSTDTGNGWRPINRGLPGISPSTGIAPVAVHDVVINERNGDMYAATDVGVFRRTNREKSWSPASAGLPGANPRTGLTPLPVRSLLVFPDSKGGKTMVLAATEAGVFRRETRDRRWQASGSGIPEGAAARALAAGYDADGSLRLYVGTDAGLFRSADGGRSWERVGAPSAGAAGEDVFPAGINTDDVRAVAAGSSGEVLAATPFNGFVRDEWPDFRIRGGIVDLAAPSARVAASAARIAPGDRVVLTQAEGSGPLRAEVYTAASVTRALRHDWERTGSVTRVEVARADGLDAFDLRAAVAWVQEEELALQEEWTEDASPLQGRSILLEGVLPPLRDAHPVVVTGRRARLSLAATGGVLRRAEKGWRCAGLRNLGVSALATAPGGTLFAGTRGRGVFRSTDGGASWTPAEAETAGLKVRALAVTAGGRIAAAISGGVRISGDDGRSWDPAGGGIPEVRALAAEADGELLGGTTRGVYRSAEGASRWEPLGTGLPPVPVRALLVTPAGDRFAGTRGGGVFRLRAGERAWAAASAGLDNLDVTALAQADDGTLFAATLGGGVFRSGDGGVRWLPAREGLRVRGVQALLAAPGGDLFAGTHGGGVFRSPDGGVSWAPDESGAANDVLALAVDGEGRVLAGARDACLLLAADGTRHERLEVDHLFTLDVAPDVLDGSAVSEGVRREFREHGTALGATAVLRVRVAGSEWVLEDGDALYSLRREGDRVTVYHPRDLLLALAAPVAVAGGALRLEARCTDGFEGWIHVLSDEVFWRSSATDDDPVGEVAQAAGSAPSDDGTSTELGLAEPLRNVYDPRTVTLCANVAHATHGATSEEVLGSGNAALANQSFVLRRTPLTYTRTPDAAGTASTLVVRVDGVRWTEVDSLHARDSLARVYQVDRAESGRTVVTFGDGVNGARLPTGVENVTATYRVGIGPEGNLDAGALRLLRTPAVGVRRVNNPVPATGGAAPETPEEARRHAPLRSSTLHRIVSFRDYEDFARTYPGVARALAAEVWDGRRKRLHLTVVPADGSPLDRGSELYQGLVESIGAASLATRPFTVQGPEELRFRLSALVRFDSRYREKDVEAAVRDALAARFARERRDFGEGVAESEVIAAAQGVAGVVSLELRTLHLAGYTPALAPLLPAELARWDAEAGEVRPAQLLVLDPQAGVTLQLREAR